MSVIQNVEKFFAANGPLAQKFDFYSPRKGQVKMATEIASCFKNKQHAIIEAGTGIGKSFAYLIPALLTEKRRFPIVVSTGTIALQEQLIEKDIPQLAHCFDKPIKAVLAKGRGNYICEHRFKKAFQQSELIAQDTLELDTLKKINGMIGQGILTRSNIPGVISDDTWSHIMSESGVCGGTKCKQNPCSFMLSRRELNSADIIVVNHSLLFVHLSLSRLGISLLPKFTQLILDESHHCPDIATEQFGIDVSNTKLKFFLDRLYNPKNQKGFLARIKPNPTQMKILVEKIRENSEDFFGGLKYWLETKAPKNGRLISPEPFDNKIVSELIALSELLEHWASSSDNSDEENEFRSQASKAKSLSDEIDTFIRQSMKDSAYWIENNKPNSRFERISGRAAPLDISTQLRELLTNNLDSVIMTSATLSVESDLSFCFYKRRMGIEESYCSIHHSPFEYDKNVALITYKNIRSPHDPLFERDMPNLIMNSLELTHAGAFILVTNYNLLKRIYSFLENYALQKKYLLLAQGLSGTRQKILDDFRNHPNAILIGNQTFWEGIDIPGPNLRNIIIAKLPFEVPSHPLQEARYENIKEKGGNPFTELSLPNAIMKFKQGFGRLIRRTNDKGIVSILDSRIHSKRYGSDFLSALPICQNFIDEHPQQEFLNSLNPK